MHLEIPELIWSEDHYEPLDKFSHWLYWQ